MSLVIPQLNQGMFLLRIMKGMKMKFPRSLKILINDLITTLKIETM